MRKIATTVAVVIAATVTFVGLAAAGDIRYRKSVTLSIGQSTVIHGARGNCGEPAPSWARVKAHLPHIAVARYSDGDLGTRNSNSCGGPTPARAVVVTGVKQGSEKIVLFGDPITITVK
ncbi:hypothetical protein ABGN05_22040 [Aquibium sp. LZ166]|uniref:Uncharacterized protein n=1 Tax=Aquibium pacificus TaxID=3153579 RepID=A0ABV3SNI2_9HYPH